MSKTKVIEFLLNMGDGGAETLVKDYVLLLDKTRFDVTVVVLHDIVDSANLQRLRDHNIDVIALSSQEDILKKIWHTIFWSRKMEAVDSQTVMEKPVLPGATEEKGGVIHSCRHYLRNLYFGIRFLQVVKKSGTDVVHGHLEVLHCLKTIGPLLRGIRLFHTCHALPELVYEGREKRAAEYLIENNGMQLIALHADMAAQINSMFPQQKTVVIHNGINLDLFRNPDVSGEEKREELAIPRDAFLVGHVGRFTPEKNHAFLVEVFREIQKRKENAYLLMVGAEDHSAVEEKLHSYGLQNKYQLLSGRKDVNELLAAMDVFVFPSIFEGFGIALLEAQAAGLRCVASDCCPADVFRTENCIALPLGDSAVWAETVLNENIKSTEIKNLSDYDMRKEICRLEKLYLGQLEQ